MIFSFFIYFIFLFLLFQEYFININRRISILYFINFFILFSIYYFTCPLPSLIAIKSTKTLWIIPPLKCSIHFLNKTDSVKENKFCNFQFIIRCDKFYSPDSSLVSHFRTTSFGLGDKYDFTRDASCSPPPNTYTLEDDFQKNIKKGFGFGKGR